MRVFHSTYNDRGGFLLNYVFKKRIIMDSRSRS